MSTRARLAACFVLSLSLLLPAVAWAATDARSSSGAEDVLVDLVNDRRAEVGLPPLTPRADLHGLARDWSFTQAERGALGHNPDLADEACCWTRIAENVARSGGHQGEGATAVARALMDLWRSSGGHDAAMTDGEVDQLGVGVVIDDDGTAWGTTVFRRCDGSSCVGGAQGPAADTSRSWAPPPPPEPEPTPEPAPAPEPEAQPRQEAQPREAPSPEPAPAPEPGPDEAQAPPPPPPPAAATPAPTPSPTPSPSPAPTPSPTPATSPVEAPPLVVAAFHGQPDTTPVEPWPLVVLLGAALAAMAAIVRQLRR